jgi:hypothetical protein
MDSARMARAVDTWLGAHVWLVVLLALALGALELVSTREESDRDAGTRARPRDDL